MKLEQAFALMLFTATPACVVFLILLLLDVHIVMVCLIAGGVFGFGLDVCLFSEEENTQYEE